MNVTKRVSFAVLLTAFAMAPTTPLFGQATVGRAAVTGTVRDATGAAVPEARAALINTDRGVRHESVTNAAGIFLFPDVPASTYSLLVAKEGFESWEVRSLTVQVGERAAVEVTLKLGAVSTVVSVSGDTVALLETESNSIGTVVDSARVDSLPLNGRDFLQLALLSGASNIPAGFAGSDITNQIGHPDRQVAVAGNHAAVTEYTINGIAARGARVGELSLNLSVAAVDQFKVQQSFFMPDQGPNPAMVNITTRGGGNRIHGQAFEFLRNGALDARNFFSPDAEDLHRNQFGFALGGPIRKDKLWFYGFYEGLRQVAAFSSGAYTPTASMFGGNLGELSTPIFDPGSFSAATGQRAPFVNNLIPASRINPVSKRLLDYYLPGSSVAQRPSNLFANPRKTLRDDQYGIRLDSALSTRHSLFGQFLQQDSPAANPGIFKFSGNQFPMESTLAMLQHTWTLSPSAVNTLRVGFVRTQSLLANEGRDAGDLLSKIGIANTLDNRGVTRVAIQGYSPFGNASGDLGNIDNNYQLDEGINYIRGTHNFQAGASLRYYRTSQQNANGNAVGSLSFQPTFTAQLARNAQGQLAPMARTGDSFGDFLVGTPLIAMMAGLPRFPYRFTRFMPYFHDTWKVGRNLTLNYGVSWFLSTIPDPQGAARDMVHGFDFKTGLLTYAALGQVDPKLLETDLRNFAPRLGVTWRPSFLPKTVIRAGGGIYYSDLRLIELQMSMAAPPFNSPVSANNNALSPMPTYVLGTNFFPAATTGPLTKDFAANLPAGESPFLMAETARAPYSSQWNLSIQHALTNRDMLELVYMGSSSHRQENKNDLNQCLTTPGLYCDAATRPYLRYTMLRNADYVGNASYEAMVAKYHHRSSGGLDLRFEYTLAKALTDGTESVTSNSQDTWCRGCDKGPTSFDVRHRAVISTLYELPWGRGRRFATRMPAAADLLLGGWSLTGITTFQTGAAFTVGAPNTTGYQASQHRANRTCGGADGDLANSLRTNGLKQFDTSCFSVPATGYFGNGGRNTLYAPGLNNWDVGVEKIFGLPAREDLRLQFRAEMFNAFNHTQFGQPSPIVGTPTFGLVGSAGAPRLIQFGLKMLW